MATDPLSPVFYVYILRRPDREDPLEPGRAAPFYIGKGCNGRIKVHRKEATGYLQGKKVMNTYKNNVIVHLWKMGEDYETDIIVKNVVQNEAINIERKLIATYGKKINKTGILTNYSGGGEGVAGYNKKVSEKTKERLREIRKLQISSGMKGLHHTDETKAKISKSRTGKVAWNKGIPADLIHHKKAMAAWTGKKQTPEALNKISEASKQRWKDPAYIEKRRIAMKKVQDTQEYRANVSKAQENLWSDPAYKLKMTEAIKRGWAKRKEEGVSKVVSDETREKMRRAAIKR